MPKKKLILEQDEVENGFDENFVIVEKKKKAYRVILVTKNHILYEHSVGLCTTTPNIWGEELKTGDTIYLEEG